MTPEQAAEILARVTELRLILCFGSLGMILIIALIAAKLKP